MKNNKFFLYALALGFVGIIILLNYDSYAYGRYEKNKLKLSVEPFRAAQLPHKNTYKAFNINKEAVKNSFKFPEEVTGYIDINEMPEEQKFRVPKEHKPFFGEAGYKVILVIDSAKFKRQAIWVFDHGNMLKKIYPVEPK